MSGPVKNKEGPGQVKYEISCIPFSCCLPTLQTCHATLLPKQDKCGCGSVSKRVLLLVLTYVLEVGIRES